MNKRSKTAVWLPIVATLLFCVLAILSGRLQKQEAIGNVVSEQMTFPNGTDVSLSAGGAYGMVESEGPGLTLPAGTYRVHWTVENDGDAVLLPTPYYPAFERDVAGRYGARLVGIPAIDEAGDVEEYEDDGEDLRETEQL